MNPKDVVYNRRNDLDWLRVLGVLTVFFYHSAHFFDPGEWSVKNPVTYDSVGQIMAVFAQWMMPLMFVISGASVYYASRKTGAGEFARDKVMRLLVPLIVGVFTFSIIQVYVERVSHNQFVGSFFDFLPHYFEGVYLPGSAGNFAFHGMHLWYLMFLFIYTILLMPLFWWFKGNTGGRVLRRLGDLLALPGAIMLLAVPTIVLQNLENAGALGNGISLGGWQPLEYVWFFLGGYVLVSHERLQARIVQARWVCLGVTVALVALSFALGQTPDRHPDVLVWPLMGALLGFAAKYLTGRNRLLAYASDAVLPFYILHQNALLWIGFFVVAWPVPDIVKYLIITSSSFAASLLAYEYLVRRSDVLRIAFGLKPVRRAPAPSVILPETV